MLPLLSLLFILLAFPSTESENFLFFFFFLQLGNNSILLAALFFTLLKSQTGFLLDVDMLLGLFTAFQGW